VVKAIWHMTKIDHYQGARFSPSFRKVSWDFLSGSRHSLNLVTGENDRLVTALRYGGVASSQGYQGPGQAASAVAVGLNAPHVADAAVGCCWGRHGDFSWPAA
jgi:hypothetical protein